MHYVAYGSGVVFLFLSTCSCPYRARGLGLGLDLYLACLYHDHHDGACRDLALDHDHDHDGRAPCTDPCSDSYCASARDGDYGPACPRRQTPSRSPHRRFLVEHKSRFHRGTLTSPPTLHQSLAHHLLFRPFHRGRLCRLSSPITGCPSSSTLTGRSRPISDGRPLRHSAS